MPAKTKAVKSPHGQPIDSDGNCVCSEAPGPHAQHVPADPQLVWEKMSFKHYVARDLGGACLEVVRSGSRENFNETWHPVVFGNRFAYAKRFERMRDAAAAAERLAVEYATRVLAKLSDMPVAQRYGGDLTAYAPVAAVKLTKDQLAELKRLAQAPQSSYGKGRVRMHNNLRRHGLVLIDHSSGFVCRITQAGVDFLAKTKAR